MRNLSPSNESNSEETGQTTRAGSHRNNRGLGIKSEHLIILIAWGEWVMITTVYCAVVTI